MAIASSIRSLKSMFIATCFVLFTVCYAFHSVYAAPVQVDIYGPAQGRITMAVATPLIHEGQEGTKGTIANTLGTKLNALIEENLSFLPFVRMTDKRMVLGGTVLAGYKAPLVDFRRFQIAGASLLVTAGWPKGDVSKGTVELRVYDIFLSASLRAYNNVQDDVLVSVGTDLLLTL